MGTGTAEIDIDKSADEVWAVVGDFGGIGGWMPGIESCRVEGDDRILDTMGMTITERLVSKDDAGRALTYSIADGAPGRDPRGGDHGDPEPATPATSPGRSRPRPDEMADLMTTVYQQALEALKAHVEG